MELKTLWLGLVVSMSIFAVKTGVGWAYLWGRCPKQHRLSATFLVFFSYVTLFGLVFWLVSHVNLLAHYDMLMPLWQNGVMLHWLVALLLFLWGLFLLKSPPCESRIPSSCGLENTDFQSPTCGDVPMRTGGRSRGWLALVIPCPVCLSVVLMSVAGLVLYFPEEALAATIGLFAVFIAIAAISGIVLLLGRKGTGGSWETSLGLIMCLMALYFALTALLMPHFSEISKIYRMSVHAHHGNTEDFPLVLLGWAAIAALTFVGFVWNTWNFKKSVR